MGRRILLVDKDHLVLQKMGVRLRAMGYETITASSCENAISLAPDEIPSAIVMDFDLQGESSLSALGELRQRQGSKKIPVVMVSDHDVDEKTMRDAGVESVVRKPYINSSLIQAVESALITGICDDE